MELLLCVIGLSGLTAVLLYNRKWIYQKYIIIKMALTLLYSISFPPEIKETQNMHKFVINTTQCSASIMYEYIGKPYIVTVPYNKKHVIRMSDYKVELIYEDGKILPITQQAGVPYLVSAKSLGGKYIKVTDFESESAKIYNEDEIPGYCLDL